MSNTPVQISYVLPTLPTAQRRSGVDEEPLRSKGMSQLRARRFDRGHTYRPTGRTQMMHGKRPLEERKSAGVVRDVCK